MIFFVQNEERERSPRAAGPRLAGRGGGRVGGRAEGHTDALRGRTHSQGRGSQSEVNA